MPQLDLAIIFPQIFWLFFLFFFLYLILIHFFLPNFLFSIKSRKKIVELNSVKIVEFEKNLVTKQSNLNNLLLDSLILVKHNLLSSWISVSKFRLDPSLILVDKKISGGVFNTIQYYDSELINSINLFPKKLNLLNY